MAGEKEQQPGWHPPAQEQEEQPGREKAMYPRPAEKGAGYKGSGKLKNKVAIVTGGDSGIGRAVAILFAREAADVAIVYLNEHEDARQTQALVAEEGRRCITIAGDIGDEDFCRHVVQQTVDTFGRLDILVNNAAEQHPQERIEDISREQLLRTFSTNIFGMFYLTKAAMPHLKAGATIINTSSVTAYRGQPLLLDYSSTKGAITAFTRSLARNLADKQIRVNSVAPGPIWTPLIPSTFSKEHVEHFGEKAPMARPGQPEEVATCYVFLASDDSSYMTGHALHPDGGEFMTS